MKRLATSIVLLSALAASCRKSGSPAAPGVGDNRVANRTAALYFESPAMRLAGEPRNLQLPQSPAAAIPIVVAEFLKGPANPAYARPFPPDTVVRGAFLLPDGTAFVDLGGATLTKGWATGSHEELMAIAALTQTVAATFPEVKRLRLLINGAPAETLAGHIALDRAQLPDPSLVDRAR